MTRSEWNQRFALEMKTLTDWPTQLCLDAARESTDYFEDGHDPEDAVVEEMSYMEWD